MKVKRVVPDYVRQGSCSDCLRVWSRERDALLRQIDALERQVAALRRGPVTGFGFVTSGEHFTSRSKEE